MPQNFPEIEPSSRVYNFGRSPTSTAESFAAGGVRFLHGDDSFGHGMTLDFLDISEDDAALIRDHYRDHDGGHRSFILFSITWRGHPDVDVLVPFEGRWKYAGPPQEVHRNGKLYSVTVQLQYVGATTTS